MWQPPSAIPLPPVRRRTDLVALGLCILVGLVVSLLPHWVWWERNGGPFWIASFDELRPYLASSAGAFHDHLFRITDPVAMDGGRSMFPWIQLGPPVLLAKIMGWGPEGLPLAWRVIAGVTLPAGFYFVTRVALGRPWAAAAVTLFLLVDHGVVYGRPFDRHWVVFLKILIGGDGSFFGGQPMLLHQWRVITPALSLVFLLWFLGTLLRAREEASRGRTLAAGIALGVLVWAYFYYWTAAFAALGLLWLLEPRHRWLYFKVGTLGAVIGAPEVIGGWLMKRSAGVEWLQRSNKFVPIGHLEELSVPPVATALLVLFVAWCWWRQRSFLPVAALAVAGFALAKNQLITGQNIENFHWAYVWCPMLCLLVSLILWQETRRWWGRWWFVGLVVLGLGAQLVSGIVLRYWDVTRSRQVLTLNEVWQQFRSQRGTGFGLVPRSVVAGQGEFPDFAVALENTRSLEGTAWFSPLVDMRAMDERTALNDWLSGSSAAEFLAESDAAYRSCGPWAHDEALRRKRLGECGQAFERVAADPVALLNRHEVRYLVLPAGKPASERVRSGPWRQLQDGPYWQLWERSDRVKSGG